MRLYREFPAYNLSLASVKDNKPSVVFTLPGDNFSDGFVNNWTSFLFSIDYIKSMIDPHYVNSTEVDIAARRNNILCGDNNNGEYRNLFYENWNYDMIFWINPKIDFFDPNKIISSIMMIHESDSIDILSHNQNSMENLDLDFTIFKKNIFERIQYPWFEENKNIDKLFIQKLIDMKLNLVLDNSIYIK